MNNKPYFKTDKKVNDLYSAYPFPNFSIKTKKDIYKLQIYRLVYGLTKSYLALYRNKKIKILDVGCGTGELMLGIAKKNMMISALDRNKNSLLEAVKKSKIIGVRNVKFEGFDINRDKLPSSHFDFVYSIGVLHHLPNPESAFRKMVKSVKVGGYVTIGLYNPYGRMHIRIKRKLVRLLAGSSLGKRTEVARRLFYRRNLLPHELTFIADCYAHPLEKYYSFEQMISWFKENNIEYCSCVPPIDITENLRLGLNVIRSLFNNREKDLVSLWEKIPKNQLRENYSVPTNMNSLIVQLVWMLSGKGEFITMIGQRIK
jgi:2-polyprenyl-3-methyl-5-hydroxy-6-metoxy-1,4-benzoquinol methylase